MVKIDDSLVALRVKIIKALKVLEREHDKVTTEMIAKYLELRYKIKHTLSKIGNNLRVLREHKIVDDRFLEGVRYWSTTGILYSPDPSVKLLINFPKTIHDGIVKFSKQGKTSKNAFVVSMVTRGIKNIAPYCDTPPSEEGAPLSLLKEPIDPKTS